MFTEHVCVNPQHKEKRMQCVTPCLNPASTFNLNIDQTVSCISLHNVREMIEINAFSQKSNILTGHCVIIIIHISGFLLDLQIV